MIEKAKEKSGTKIPKMYTIDELAKETEMPKTRIRKWVVSGKLPTIRAGKIYLINYDTFINFLNGEA